MVGLMLVAIMLHITTSQRQTTRKNALVIGAILSLNIMSALDAFSTIFLVANDYSSEMNPVMNALIERSYLLFLTVKISITIIATLVCWHYYDRWRTARTVLRLFSRVYCALMAWHCLLLSSVLL